MSTSAQAATGTPKVEISDLHKFFGELHVRPVGLGKVDSAALYQ